MNKDIPQLLESSMAGTTLPAENMVKRLLQHESQIPDKVVYRLLEDGINERSSITYSKMVMKARAIAAKLQQKGEKGDRILLLFPTGIEFITSFYACLFAGMIAVPTYPPKRNKANERFNSIVRDSSPAFILSTRTIHEDLEKHELLNDLQGIENMLVYEDIPASFSDNWIDPDITEDDIALLQYTSGSTGNPNGVMVSHGNIMHNSEFIKQSFGFDKDSVGVNWLPNFHDMGLIGCLIQAAYLGASNIIIPPLAFLKSPANWFRAITKYNATTGGGPNFAFDYSIEKVEDEDLAEIDLSSLRTLYCGAEPIRDTTFKGFIEKFTKTGFKASQLFPVYGMAEVVLIASGGDYKADPIYLQVDGKALEEKRVMPPLRNDDTRTLTACGYPWLGMRLAIIDPESRKPAALNEVGEIWTSGPSVARGYWNDSEKTEETFHGYIEGLDSGPWLRTGDLGFIHEGQLYITGRLKDLIILRGLNYFPNDIEYSVENSHEAIRQNACAAFSVDLNGEERLVITAEVERAFVRDLPENEVFEAVRNAVFSEYGVQPYVISLLRTGSILKTSSGKIQRFAVRTAWNRKELTEVASWVMKTAKDPVTSEIGFRPEYLREWMINWMAQKLELDPGTIDPDKPVSAYGLDSITAVSLEKDVNSQFGVEWPIESFLKENSVNQLVEEGIHLLRSSRLNNE
jgi:acyl-CoA synthetase (AMP-forming)/AMP-acid ligase II/acyl carrier protein